MHLSDDFLQELRFRNDIVDIVSNYITLKHSGSNMVGICPFHNEDTASFMIYPDNGSFYCFGCTTGGDVITFIKKIESLDYLDAIRFLAQKSGLTMPEEDRSDSSIELRRKIFEANREAARFFHSMLYSKEGTIALNYLKGRGLTEKTIKHFGLGYSLPGRFSLINHFKKLGLSNNEILSANLAFESKKGNLVDRFFDRLMFPIIDLKGNVIAFGARVLNDEKPKYLNTSDTKVFKKSMNLFALNFAKKKSSDRLILAEGYMDVIALHQAGFIETVATLGTAITEHQAKIMKSYAKEIIIAYDADEAGQKATSRATKILRDVGLSIRVLTIPRGKDPDGFIRSFKDQGNARFNQLINLSENDIEYKLNNKRKRFNIESTIDKIEFLKEAVRILSQVRNDIEREVYISKISAELDVEKSALKSQIEKEKKRTFKIMSKKNLRVIQESMSAVCDKINPQKRYNLRAANAEEALISYIIKNQDQASNIFLKLSEEKFCTDFNKRVYTHIKTVFNKKNSICISDFSPYFSDDEVSRIVKILVSNSNFSNDENVYKDYINVILNEYERVMINMSSLKDIADIKNYIEHLKKQKK